MRRKKRVDKKTVAISAVIGILVVFGLFAMYFSLSPESKVITGSAVRGVTVSNPRLSGTGYSISYDLKISPEITAKLQDKSTVLTVAATVTDAVNQANGLAQDGLKSLLGLPSIPDTFGILASIASWFNSNADPCLRDIGSKFAGKEFAGKFIYSVSKGKGSRIYPGWDYYYATATYTGPNGFNCKVKLGCVFSKEKSTGRLSKSCFG